VPLLRFFLFLFFSTLAAFNRRIEAGGVLVTKVKERSA
jgi:hypothetical protein